jgi:PilZ domain
MNERRQAPRQRTFKTGSITLPHGVVECLIRNMSTKGALLEFLQPPLVPDDFTLLIKPEMIERRCHVTRRKALRIGVVFS